MSTTLHPTAVVRGWAEGRLLPPRRIRRGHAGRLAPHFANVRPAKFVFSSGGGMGLREGAPEETHRDSHQPPVPSAVYNPHQGPPEGDDDVPNLFNNVVNNERGGRIRARASKWDSLRDELGGQAKTSFGMSLGDPLGKNGAHASRSATEATRGDGETSDDDPPPATGKAPEPADELEELLMSKMRTTRPTGEAPASNSAKPASEKTQFSKTNEDAAKKKGDKFSAAVEIKAKKREEKDKAKKKKDTKDDVGETEGRREGARVRQEGLGPIRRRIRRGFISVRGGRHQSRAGVHLQPRTLWTFFQKLFIKRSQLTRHSGGGDIVIRSSRATTRGGRGSVWMGRRRSSHRSAGGVGVSAQNRREQQRGIRRERVEVIHGDVHG